MLYTPVLKAKFGEFTALRNIPIEVRSQIRPLFEIAPFKSGTAHLEVPLKGVAKQLRSTMGRRPWILDSPYLGDATCGDAHHLRFLVEELREVGCHFALCLGPAHTEDYRREAIRLLRKHRLPLVVRFNAEFIESSIDTPGMLPEALYEILKLAACEPTEVELVLDVGHIPETILHSRCRDLQVLLEELDLLPPLHAVIVVGGGIPKSLPGVSDELYKFPRTCWKLWKFLSSRSPVPVHFGDYGTRMPGFVEFDPTKMTVSAKIWYTGEEEFWLAKGRSLKIEGTEQYELLAKRIRDTIPGPFRGYRASPGDEYIERCASGDASTGNQTTWISVSSSQHMCFVVSQLANPSGS